MSFTSSATGETDDTAIGLAETYMAKAIRRQEAGCHQHRNLPLIAGRPLYSLRHELLAYNVSDHDQIRAVLLETPSWIKFSQETGKRLSVRRRGITLRPRKQF